MSRNRRSQATDDRPAILNSSDWRRLHRQGVPPRVLRDPELRAFVDECLPSMTFSEIADACVGRFGRKRAPSRSALHRYWRSVVRPRLVKG